MLSCVPRALVSLFYCATFYRTAFYRTAFYCATFCCATFYCNLAFAQTSGDVSLLSDYRFRGESLTEGRPAAQASLAYDHASGLFLGALLSNVHIEPAASGLSGQFYGGYARPFADRKSWEVGAVTYVFPHPAVPPDYDYSEIFVGASMNRLSARLYYSKNYFQIGSSALYSELSAEQPIIEHVALVGHLGYLRINSPARAVSQERVGSQADLLIGVVWNVLSFNIGLALTGTGSRRDSCPTGTGHCNTAAVASISRPFN
jgi:uncharacterized protein (TIGR02001 family)